MPSPKVTVWYSVGKYKPMETPAITGANVEEGYAGIDAKDLPKPYEIALHIDLIGSKIPIAAISIYLPDLLEILSKDEVTVLQKALNAYLKRKIK